MLQKLALVFYVLSSLALAYVIFIFSPAQFGRGEWQKSDSSLYFFPAAVIFIIHIVFTGKIQSQEKFTKVIWVSSALLLLVAVIMLPRALVFLFY